MIKSQKKVVNYEIFSNLLKGYYWSLDNFAPCYFGPYKSLELKQTLSPYRSKGHFKKKYAVKSPKYYSKKWWFGLVNFFLYQKAGELTPDDSISNGI